MSHYHVIIEDREFEIEVACRSGKFEVSVNGRTLVVENNQLTGNQSLLLIDHESLEVDVRQNGTGASKTVFMRGVEIPVTVEDYHLAQLRKTAGITSGPALETTLKAPMPGLLLDVRVTPGQKVKKGDPLIVIEAMKMENIIKAKAPAAVKAVRVTAGQSVEKGDLLLEFE